MIEKFARVRSAAGGKEWRTSQAGKQLPVETAIFAL
jgi:hypothetical protein